MKKIPLSDSITEKIRECAKRNSVSRVVLFGSRARGDNRERSDIDLAVYGGNVAAFCAELDGEAQTLLTFDVVDMGEGEKVALSEEISRDGITVYEEV